MVEYANAKTQQFRKCDCLLR